MLQLPDFEMLRWKDRADRVAKREVAWQKARELRDPDELLAALRNLTLSDEQHEDLGWTITVYERAERLLAERAVPASARVQLLLDYAGRLGDQHVRGMAATRRALELAGDSSSREKARRALAALLLSSGEHSEAIQILTAASRDVESEAESRIGAYHDLAQELRTAGKAKEAELVRQAWTEFMNTVQDQEARNWGWRQMAELHRDEKQHEAAVDAYRQTLVGERDPKAIVELYEYASGLPEASRQSVAKEVLDRAKAAAGAAGSLTALIELAQKDLADGRASEARGRAAEAERMLLDLPANAATRQELGVWRVEISDLREALRSAKEGDPTSARRMISFVDDEGVPLSANSPAVVKAREEDEQIFAALDGSAEDRTKVLASLPEDLKARFEELTALYPVKEGLPGNASLSEKMKRLDAKPDFDTEEGWIVLQQAAKAGHHDWAIAYTEPRLRRMAAASPQFFYLQSTVESLLDIFAAKKDWAAGWRLLTWWREVIAETDHPESTRLDEVFSREARWAERSGNLERQRTILHSRIEFAARVQGGRSRAARSARSGYARTLRQHGAWAQAKVEWDILLGLPPIRNEFSLGPSEVAAAFREAAQAGDAATFDAWENRLNGIGYPFSDDERRTIAKAKATLRRKQ